MNKIDILKYINERNLILVPTMLIIGYCLKKIDFIKNKYIPLVLIIISCILTILFNYFNNTDSNIIVLVIQGILIGGTSVGLHQSVKQLK